MAAPHEGVKIYWLLPESFGYIAMAPWPGIIFARKGENLSVRTIIHEKIHHAQQREMLVVGFFIWYGVEYLVRRLRRPHREAYRAISFEAEAYDMDFDGGYLRRRRFWRWVRYLGSGGSGGPGMA